QSNIGRCMATALESIQIWQIPLQQGGV
ncbi:MAG: hypothetical protein ACI8RD_008099, partial [Bacillariaceae sp.]